MTANQVTLRNGEIVTVTQDNYRALALQQIELQRRIDGIVDTATQSAVLQAFKQIAGLPTNAYTYGGGVAIPNDNGASKVLTNPLVRASDAIMNSLPDGVRKLAQDSSDGTVSFGGSIAANVKSGGVKIVETVRSANQTALVLGMAVIFGFSAYFVYKFKP